MTNAPLPWADPATFVWRSSLDVHEIQRAPDGATVRPVLASGALGDPVPVVVWAIYTARIVYVTSLKHEFAWLSRTRFAGPLIALGGTLAPPEFVRGVVGCVVRLASGSLEAAGAVSLPASPEPVAPEPSRSWPPVPSLAERCAVCERWFDVYNTADAPVGERRYICSAVCDAVLAGRARGQQWVLRMGAALATARGTPVSFRGGNTGWVREADGGTRLVVFEREWTWRPKVFAEGDAEPMPSDNAYMVQEGL